MDRTEGQAMTINRSPNIPFSLETFHLGFCFLLGFTHTFGGDRGRMIGLMLLSSWVVLTSLITGQLVSPSVAF